MMVMTIEESCRGSFKEMKIVPLRCQYIYSLMRYVVNNRFVYKK
jgi:hypothetical protein